MRYDRRKDDSALAQIAESLTKLTEMMETGPHTEADYMLDISPDGVLLINRHGVIVRANRRAETMFWYAPGSMNAMPLDNLVPKERRERHHKHRDGYFGAPRTREMGVGMILTAERADGSEFPVEIALAPFQRPGEDLRVMAVVRDKTERTNDLLEDGF